MTIEPNLRPKIYRLDDKTLAITAEPNAQINADGSLLIGDDEITSIGISHLWVRPDFSAYYFIDEATLQDTKQDILTVRAYAAEQKQMKKPCYLTMMKAKTDLTVEIIRHVLNTERGFAPI